MIKAVTGEDVSAEGTGGAATHNKERQCPLLCENREACIEQIKTLLSYLPANNGGTAAGPGRADPIDRAEESTRKRLNQMNRAYDMMGR